MSKPGEPMDLDDVFVKKTAPTFKIGDVVHLKSGGSMMTVCQISPDGQTISCYWHTADGAPVSWHYPPESLVLYNEPKQDTPEIIGTDPASSDWRKKHGLA